MEFVEPVRARPRQATRRSWTSATLQRSPRRCPRTRNSTRIPPSFASSRSCEVAPRPHVPLTRTSPPPPPPSRGGGGAPRPPAPPPRPPPPPPRGGGGGGGPRGGSASDASASV